jgi:hypothetical protein
VFITAKTYPSGEGVDAAAVQDFNNDGFDDIVSANLTDKNVSVFLNNGNGSFGPANNLSVGVGAIEVASGDLDGDGNADLVVTDANTSAHVALGNGDGTFGAFSTITLHSQPKGIAIADLNSDGIPDLAIAIFGPANTFNGEVAVLIGNGDGSFAPPVFYELGTQQGNRVVATDLNNDGKLDLAVAIQHGSHPTNGLAVLLGNGDGTFQPAVTSVSGVNATDVAAADFNSDGKMDLALANSSPLYVVDVVLGNGDGTFQPATAYSTEGVANTVSVADVNRDGFADLVVGSSHTAVLLGDGTGSFGPAAVYWIGQSLVGGFARVGYFNHDQIPDIVGNGGSSEIAVAFGRANGVFNAPRVFPIGAYGLDLADFDGDGYADVVVSNGGELFFLHGVGDGSFAEPILFATLSAKDVIAADFNGDGKEDVLALPFNGNFIYAVLGNGDGTFQPPVLITVPINSFYGFDAAVSDFNHDGKTDLALTDFTTDSLLILLGNGDGTFQSAITYHTPDGPQAPITADFNLDGNVDVAISQASSRSEWLGFGYGFSIYLGHGDGTFDSPLTTELQGALALVSGDLNRDGKPDLVVGGDGVQVCLGNGDGTFGLPETVYSNFDFGSLTVGDIDLDGRPDIMVSFSQTTLVGLRGQGDGTFRPPVEFLMGDFPTVGRVVLKDLNGDGAPEAIVGGISDPLTVLLNASRRHR